MSPNRFMILIRTYDASAGESIVFSEDCYLIMAAVGIPRKSRLAYP